MAAGTLEPDVDPIRHLRRALRLVAVVVVLATAPSAHAKDPYKRAYAGRVTTLAGAGAIGLGLTTMGLGRGLGVYDFHGPWWEKE